MAHELVDAQQELLEDAQPRLDGAEFGPEFNVTGHLCSVVYFCFRTPQITQFTRFTRFFGAKTLEATKSSFFFLKFEK